MTDNKKDKLYEYVQHNREEFDVLDVDSQIWERINKAQPKGVKKTKIHPILWRAAAAVVLLTSAWWISQHFDVNTVKVFSEEIRENSINKEIPQLQEAEKLYGEQANVLLSKLDEKLSTYPELKAELNTDLAELDSTFAQYKHELNTAPSTEDVVHAMIQIYRMKVDILQQLHDELQRKERNSNNNSGNNEINL